MEASNIKSALHLIPKISISYSNNIPISERPSINHSVDTYKLLMQVWDINTIELLEEFKIILLNQKMRVLGIYDLSRGGITGTVADPRIIFIVALNAGAPWIILAHNHPSGLPQPSEADVLTTKKLKAGAELLSLHILDHVIITKESYFSFLDQGLL